MSSVLAIAMGRLIPLLVLAYTLVVNINFACGLLLLLLLLRLLERALGLEILAFRYLTQLRQLLVAEALSDLPPATLAIGGDPSPNHGALGRTLLMPSTA